MLHLFDSVLGIGPCVDLLKENLNDSYRGERTVVFIFKLVICSVVGV